MASRSGFRQKYYSFQSPNRRNSYMAPMPPSDSNDDAPSSFSNSGSWSSGGGFED